MRKDIFIVGARLLGVWQLLGAFGSLSWLITMWLGYIRPQSYGQEYSSVHFVVQLATGLYLLFRTDHLFDLLDRLKVDKEEVQEDKHDINQVK